MTLIGARGETANQINKVFPLTSQGNDTISSSLRALIHLNKAVTVRLKIVYQSLIHELKLFLSNFKRTEVQLTINQ